jgi:hypothetical protein
MLCTQFGIYSGAMGRIKDRVIRTSGRLMGREAKVNSEEDMLRNPILSPTTFLSDFPTPSFPFVLV